MDPEKSPELGAGERLPALKAERIQERLRKFRGWRLVEVGPGITRVFAFDDSREALSWLYETVQLVLSRGVDPHFELLGSFVVVRLASLEEPGAVSELDFELARLLDRWGGLS